MLDLIGAMLASIVIPIDLIVILTKLTTSLFWRIIAAGVAGAWIGLTIIEAANGGLQTQGTRLTMFAVPLLVFVTSILLSRPFKSALLAIPSSVLIGLNAARLFGFLFLMLAAEGRLSGPFPQFAGWGDMITGVLAIPLAWSLAQKPGISLKYVIAWNIFGAADLINAISLAVLSTNGSVLQVIHAGVGAAAMASLPWALVPTFLVPFYFVTHLAIFAQAKAALRGTTSNHTRVVAAGLH